jgi:hypothetical protein
MKTSLYKHYFNYNVCWKGVLKKLILSVKENLKITEINSL